MAGNAGVPDSASVQEVIFWQGRTIQMMYHIIGQAMQRAGVHDQHPRDYLAFYCLGQWQRYRSSFLEHILHCDLWGWLLLCKVLL